MAPGPFNRPGRKAIAVSHEHPTHVVTSRQGAWRFLAPVFLSDFSDKSISVLPTDKRIEPLHAALMTQPRALTVLEGKHGLYHCVTRCVRRAWLCGIDPLTGVNHEARKAMIEARILELGSIFAVGIYAYAVMSNHLHVALAIEPEAAKRWSDSEVVERWVRLFPAAEPEQREAKKATLLASSSAVDIRRKRLMDLSWFMRCLDEYIARRANAEDDVTGRFWEGRFKCQSLDDERALAAAMAYVDLNPVRAGISDSIDGSDHTSVQARATDLRKNPSNYSKLLMPIAGFGVFLPSGDKFDGNMAPTGSRLPMTSAQYIELVDYTGRQIKPGKRGVIASTEPQALQKLGLDADYWAGHVIGFRSAYQRFVGSVAAMTEKAKALNQQWLKGIGYARSLAANR